MKKTFKFNMIRATIRSNLDSLKEALGNDLAQAKMAAQDIIESEIKGTIKKGLSPVKGQRKLAVYSELYKTAIKKGYYSKFDKKQTPSTLKLSGEMLDMYKAWTLKSKPSIYVGIPNEAPQEIKELATYHQEGTSKMPSRPFIPRQGEQFTARITNKFREMFSNVLGLTLKKLNKGRK